MLSGKGRPRLPRAALWLRRGPPRPQTPPQPVPSADVEELLRVARLNFVAIQAAWDRADLPALSALALSPLAAEFKRQLDLRGAQSNHTEVVTLDARLLAFEELSEACVASVEFSGLIRESLGDVAAPFREMWLLARIKRSGLDWKLARVQSLS